MYLGMVRVMGELSRVSRHGFWLGDVVEEKGRKMGWFCGFGTPRLSLAK